MTKKLIIDCDPGVDDAIALFLAFAARDAFDLLGVTTVAGNVGATLTARNACVIREIAAREDVPVFRGAARPIMGGGVAAEHFHGQTGLGTLGFSAPKTGVARGHAAAFLVETLSKGAPRSIALATMGPLTNVALALLLEPGIAEALCEIVVMGGAREEGGNITASAEYNIYADPHAAAIVFGCGAPIVAIGLDATHQVRTNPARMARFRSGASARAKAVVDLLTFGESVERDLAGRTGAPMHDPSTIAYLLEPSMFETKPCLLRVETESALTRGHTAVEFRDAAASATRWATRVDDEAMFELMARLIL